ncbi:hypothetical protein SAMIE_1029390 [Sphingobium amiense]|uniref:DUF4139 domain-containing protein n=1 Tax=Sphingobium amiense TaxID=135719 RepID=A0A494W8E2_9SPHN|nr:DUF4139 domain-containing protein [Sphingobium amiense]BBD99438.1 hypothetical protein SAMIE_1029390 [Sphingobium amiense]
MARLLLFLALLLSAPGAAEAGTVVSDRADRVSVTVYRQPGRVRGAMDRLWPGGYALISETRTVDLPAGESTLRFEGVAEGLMPETAVLSGMPRGVREKNRDARLLSPAGLVDAYLKRRVTLQRTNRKTGKVIQEDAIVSAGPMGGVIVQTQAGYEALGCSGLPERMLLPAVPAGLSARPTLSVIASADRPIRATLQLTYLAEGFDWSADYVADVQADGKTLDLMAWLTVANGGVTAFPDARLSVIAGQPNKGARAPQPRPGGGPLRLSCWPMDITSTHPVWALFPVQMASRAMEQMDGLEDVVVTAQRRSVPMIISVAAAPAPPPAPPPPPEDVGDLKLYRVPVPVDISASGQKQVVLLRQPGAAVERLYAGRVEAGDGSSRPMTLRLRLQNRKSDGLGLPLPSGKVAVFEQVDGARMLAGEADVADKAEGERVDYDIAQSADVRLTTRVSSGGRKTRRWSLGISNARPFDVVAEVTIAQDIQPRPAAMERRGDSWIWRITVPANDSRTLDYEERLPR